MKARFEMFLLVVLLAAAAPLSAQEATAAPEKTFVGSETCASCHDEVAANLTETPHGRAGFAALSAHGCETCHGPGSAHAEDPDNVELRPRLTALTAAEQSQTCLTCHESGKQLWHGGRHEARGLSCTSCHKDTRAETWITESVTGASVQATGSGTKVSRSLEPVS